MARRQEGRRAGKDGMSIRRRKRLIRSEAHASATIADPDARLLARLREIRCQIEAGTYLTDDKLEFVVDCLCEVLNKGRKGTRRATA